MWIESSIFRHRKLLKAGEKASWLWLSGLAYCQEGLTDGFIPHESLPYLGVKHPQKCVKKLLDAKLWEEVDGGWKVHDYLSYNKSADEIRRIRGEKRKAGLAGGVASGEARRSTQSKQLLQPESEDRLKQMPKHPSNHPVNHPANPSTSTSTSTSTLKEADALVGEAERRSEPATSQSSSTSFSASAFGGRAAAAPASSADSTVLADPSVTTRAADFLERYKAIYRECRNGAVYRVMPARDHPYACDLVAHWPDAVYLEKMAELFLRKKDWAPKNEPGTIGQFLHMAPQCDSLLAQHGHRDARAVL